MAFEKKIPRVRLLAQLAKFLRDEVHPDRFDYSSYFGRCLYDEGPYDDEEALEEPAVFDTARPVECGTTACAAGWATYLFPELYREDGDVRYVDKDRGELSDCSAMAAFLDIPEGHSEYLFIPNNGYLADQMGYRAPWESAGVSDVADHIDLYIKYVSRSKLMFQPVPAATNNSYESVSPDFSNLLKLADFLVSLPLQRFSCDHFFWDPSWLADGAEMDSEPLQLDLGTLQACPVGWCTYLWPNLLRRDKDVVRWIGPGTAPDTSLGAAAKLFNLTLSDAEFLFVPEIYRGEPHHRYSPRSALDSVVVVSGHIKRFIKDLDRHLCKVKNSSKYIQGAGVLEEEV